jgi:single-stranded DNA-binding protein
MNKVQVSGFIGTEPRVHATANGKVASFRMALNNGKDREPTWITVVAWDEPKAPTLTRLQHATFVEKYLKKGKPIMAFAKITSRKYTPQGATEEREVTEYVVTDGFEFLPSNTNADARPAQAAQPAAAAPAMVVAGRNPGEEPEDDPIPF